MTRATPPVRKADLTFVDELPGGGHAGRQAITHERVEAMMENEGRWLQWPSKSTSSAVVAILRPYAGTFEVAGRKVDHTYVTFARYLGLGTPVTPDESALLGPSVPCPTCDERLPCTNANDKDAVTASIAKHFRTTAECKAAAVRANRGGRAR